MKVQMDKLHKVHFLIFTTLVVATNPQKVPPGVNPNSYQQPPPVQQQYQPPPPPPPQQVQYHQPIQSAIPQELHHPPPPPAPAHGAPQPHHDHHGQPQLLNAANLAEEKEHLHEHLNANIDTSKMTEQELQFHYFKMHDADNNNKLDGCELIKSLIHWHEQGHQDPSSGQQTPPRDKIFTDEELTNLIDPILNMDDADGDGFIDYPEFVRAQQKAAAAAAQPDDDGNLQEKTGTEKSDEELAEAVDSLLQTWDKDMDGFVDWIEFQTNQLGSNLNKS